jgi:hypothetical protein
MSGKETADLKIVETTVAAAASLPSSFTYKIVFEVNSFP